MVEHKGGGPEHESREDYLKRLAGLWGDHVERKMDDLEFQLWDVFKRTHGLTDEQMIELWTEAG